jgi:two-component system sensor histidine kinase KdpD
MAKTNNKNKTPEDFIELIKSEERGNLKLYLGAAAGVGKTYHMLAEGKALKNNGIDVVIGYMEPHDRAETIVQAEGLESVPPKVVEYGKLSLKEMDLDAVLKRHPEVALVDELAHTNVKGSKNIKRYQDVQELLDAGINVMTTLNVQHLESLYNIIEQSTGVKVAERIPDSVVSKADLIENVDLEASDLIARLKAGKIYKLDKIDTALNNFFTVKNLTRLREIALSEAANLLDKRQREEFPGTDSKLSALNKVMMAISGGSPDFEAMLRKTSRLASQLNAKWYVVHVSTLAEETKLLSPSLEFLPKILELAKTMGAEVITLKYENVPLALVQFAKANGITHLVMGRPEPKRFGNFFRKSYFDILAESLPEVDIIVA